MRYLLLLLALPAWATNVYLPAVGAVGCSITTASSATPTVITTAASCALSPGDIVAVLTGNDPFSSSGIGATGYEITGLRKIKAVVVASTQFSLTDINDVDIAGPASFACTPIPSYRTDLFHNSACGRIIKLTTYAAHDHPRVMGLDGSAGSMTAAIKDTSVTGRANNANPAWVAVNNSVTTATPNYQGWCFVADGNLSGGFNAAGALVWNVTGNVTALNIAKWGVTNNTGLGFPCVSGGSFGCIETGANLCGNRTDLDYARLKAQNYALTYDLIYSQLNSQQKTDFANMVLNDNARGHNGLGMAGAPLSACNNPMTTGGTLRISQSGTALTLSGTGTNDFSHMVAGTFIQLNDDYSYTYITAITDATHATAINLQTITNATYYSARPWQSSDCGYFWWMKHHPVAPPWVDGANIDYPDGNGANGNTGLSNQAISMEQSVIALSLALVDDDARAVECLAMAAAFFYDQELAYYKNNWTGFNHTNYDYAYFRTLWGAAHITATLKAGIVSGPDYSGGNWLSKAMPAYWMQTEPYDNDLYPVWGDPGSVDMNTFRLPATPILTNLYASTDDAKHLWYWMKNVRSFWTSSALRFQDVQPLYYVFQDPSMTATDFTGVNTQYLFDQTDYGDCGTYGYTCNSNRKLTTFISTTGLRNPSASNDTQVFLNARNVMFDDHTSYQGGQSGTLHIFKDAAHDSGVQHGCLLSGDSQSGCASADNQDSPLYWGAGGGRKTINIDSLFTNVLRWAGTTSTGPSSNKYAYVAVDTAGYAAAASNISTAQRHVAHMKLTGNQDYIFDYTYQLSSSGIEKQTFLPYWCPQTTTVGCNVTYSGNGSSPTILSQPSSTSQIRSKVLQLSGNLYAYTENANGSYSGGNGYTYRVGLCAATGGAPTTCDTSNTSFEALVVHQPAANNSATMPTITQLSETNFWVTQVADSGSPKVVAFGKVGSTYPGINFTSTHSGTAQYLIAGLAAGTYNFKLGGVTQCANVVVPDGDNSLYCESAAGVINVGALPPVCSITPNSAGPYTQGVAISTLTFTATNCGTTLTWASSGLPTGLSGCNGTMGTSCSVTGTPSAAATFNTSISLTGDSTTGISFPIVVNPGPSGSGIGGKVSVGGNVVIR